MTITVMIIGEKQLGLWWLQGGHGLLNDRYTGRSMEDQQQSDIVRKSLSAHLEFICGS